MWFQRKNKDPEKLISEMKKKTEQIDKLKQEVNEMGNLVLGTDGKLKKKEGNQAAQPLQNKEEQINKQIEEEVKQEMLQRTSQPQRPMPKAPEPIGPTEQEIIQYQKEMARQAQYEEQLRQQMKTAMEQQQQASMNQTRQEEEQRVQVNVELDNGGVLQVFVLISTVDDILNQFVQAVNNQMAITVGNRVINGRNIVQVYVEEQ